MDGFTALAEMLLEREVIFNEDLIKIFGERPGTDSTQASHTESKTKESDNGSLTSATSEDTGHEEPAGQNS